MKGGRALTTLSIRISEEEKQKLQKFCEEYDLTMSQVIRRAVKEYINEYSKKFSASSEH